MFKMMMFKVRSLADYYKLYKILLDEKYRWVYFPNNGTGKDELEDGPIWVFTNQFGFIHWNVHRGDDKFYQESQLKIGDDGSYGIHSVCDVKEFKEMKFLLKSDEENLKLQKYLTGLGYSWDNGEGGKIHEWLVKKRFILTTADGGILWDFLERFDRPANQHIPEYRLEETEVYELKEVPPEMIEINGKNYLKSDFDKFLVWLGESNR